MATQKALFIDKFVFSEPKGNNWTLKSGVPIHKPGPGQILVKNQAVALNPVDWKVRELGWFVDQDSQYPALIGTDIAGIVEEVGPDVTSFKKGDRVVFQGAWSHTHGGYQQFTISDANTTAKIPEHLSFDQAATIPVALAVAAVGFYHVQDKGADLREPFYDPEEKAYAGQSAVIIGGGSSVGQFAIQLAKLSGFSQIITTASPAHEAFLKGLGATHVIDRKTSHADVVAKVKSITANSPVKFAFDSISEKETQQLAHDLTVEHGTTIVVLPRQIQAAPNKRLYHALGIFGLPGNKDFGDRFYAALYNLLEKKYIKPNRHEVLPHGLAGVADGLQKLKTISGTKLVVHPQETP